MLELSSPSQTAPLRLSLVGQNNIAPISSQKKKRKSSSIAGPSSFDEENAPNTFLKSNCELSAKKRNQSPQKSPKMQDPVECKTMTDCTIPTISTETKDLDPSSIYSNPSPNVSECETAVSSVSERREWLKNFEKKQASNAFRSMDKDKARDNDDRNNHETNFNDKEKEGRELPPVSSVTNVHTKSSFPSTSNIMNSQNNHSAVTSSAKKPRKPRPEINRRASSSGVKATDDGYASVASLSKWLEADPTSAKKKRHVRRGRNIISKSRQFEKDSENVIIMETKISRGAVGDKKKWLQNAFQSTIEEDVEDDTSSIYSGYTKSDVGRFARSYPRYNRQGAQTEIITNDAASSLSVADKKDWLKKAFSKNSEERKNLGFTKAQSDVMYNRGQPRDEAVSRAKLRFKERSARKLLSTNAASANSDEGTGRVAPVEFDKDSVFRSTKFVQISENVEEDSAPMDFRAARDALVQRSNKNGHDTEVVNKVFLRKKKIEKLEEDSQRKSMGVGLVLKASWDIADTSKGRPSNVYEKKYVPASDIAPKKSFEELP